MTHTGAYRSLTVSENREQKRPESELCVSKTHLSRWAWTKWVCNPGPRHHAGLTRPWDARKGRKVLPIREGGRMEGCFEDCLTLGGYFSRLGGLSRRSTPWRHSWVFGEHAGGGWALVKSCPGPKSVPSPKGHRRFPGTLELDRVLWAGENRSRGVSAQGHQVSRPGF